MPKVWPSSTFTTPSLPTFSMASAMMFPISSSAAEMAATRAICSLPAISLDCLSRSCSVTWSTADSMPRRRARGFAPAATFFRPWRTIVCASSVAVVVPSPATSFVAVATSRTSCAPWFSNTSSTSISRAIVTPSFVIVGAPNFLSSTTYRPLGPSVTLTASARTLTPRSSARRASSSNFRSLCAIQFPPFPWLGARARHLLLLAAGLRAAHVPREHVGLPQDQVLVRAELDVGAAVLREDDLVALGHLERDQLTAIVAGAGADGQNAPALGLLLGRVRKDDPACRGLLVFEGLHDQAVAQRLQIHQPTSSFTRLCDSNWHSLGAS